jgi:hypothetical protein
MKKAVCQSPSIRLQAQAGSRTMQAALSVYNKQGKAGRCNSARPPL